MGKKVQRWEEPPVHVSIGEQRRGSGIIFALVALALVLAIAFFYLTNDHRGDRQADRATQAAESLDDAAQLVGTAAKDAAETLRRK